MAEGETTWLRDRRKELQTIVGDAVRSSRLARPDGMSQADLARRMGEVLDELEPDRPAGGALTFQTTVSRIEGGRYPISLEVVDVLALALDVNPLVLIEPALARAPRDATAIVRHQNEEFAGKVEAIYERIRHQFVGSFDGDLGRRAVDALGQLGVANEREFETAVLMLEGLAKVRLEEETEALSHAGQHRRLNPILAAVVVALAHEWMASGADELDRMQAGDGQ